MSLRESFAGFPHRGTGGADHAARATSPVGNDPHAVNAQLTVKRADAHRLDSHKAGTHAREHRAARDA